jgi:hypothetical protein
VSYKKQELITLSGRLRSPAWIRVAHHFSLQYFVFFGSVSCFQLRLYLSIVHFLLTLRFSLTFIYLKVSYVAKHLQYIDVKYVLILKHVDDCPHL